MPIEVKSSPNYSAISLERFNGVYKNRIGESYIIYPKNLSISDGIVKIPPYMLFAAF